MCTMSSAQKRTYIINMKTNAVYNNAAHIFMVSFRNVLTISYKK